MKCGTCKHLKIKSEQQYHDCRESSPHVVVSGFRPNPTNPETTLGKIMTVWPRVSVEEDSCSKYVTKD